MPISQKNKKLYWWEWKPNNKNKHKTYNKWKEFINEFDPNDPVFKEIKCFANTIERNLQGKTND